MTERFTIEIELRGIDEASDELQTVAEKLKSLGISVADVAKASGAAQESIQSMTESAKESVEGIADASSAAQERVQSMSATMIENIERLARAGGSAQEHIKSMSDAAKEGVQEVGEASDKARDRLELLNEALKENKISALESAEAVDELLKKSRASNQTFKALSESAKVFSDRLEFVGKQLNTIANFGAKVNNIYNSINSMMTRLNTAQIAYNEALEEQRELVRELAAELGLSGFTLEELRQEILGKLEVLADAEDPTPSMIRYRKELTKALEMLEKSERDVAKAAQAVADAKAHMAQQMFAVSLMAIGLVPAFMQVANSISTLYALLGPFGLALVALTVVLPLIAAHWEQIEAALKPVADAIWSVVGPALEWLWKNILKPFVEFLIKSLISNIETARKFFIAVGDAVLWLAKGFEWFWKTILVPLGNFIARSFINYINAWAAGFVWIRDQVLVPFASFIANVFINYINAWAAGFIWLRDQVLVPLGEVIAKIYTIYIKALAEAFVWLRDHILAPFAMFVSIIIINNIKDWIAAFTWAYNQITSIFNAIKDIFESTFGWIRDNILMPFAAFIANTFINYINVWIAGLAWAHDQITSIFNAIKDIIEITIGWIWNQVLMPFAAFIANTFINYINVWIAGLAWAHDQITSIFNAIKDIFESTIGWIQDLLVQFGTFIANVFINYIRTWIAGFIWARDQITSIFNAIKDIIERTIGWILNAINSLSKSLVADMAWVSHELVGGSIIPEMWKDIRAWTEWGVNEVNKLMSEVGFGFNPTIRGPISINVAVNITSPAASAEEIAEVVSREIARRLRAI